MRRKCWLFVAVAFLAAAPSIAQEQRPYEWNDVERIVAVGDIHGAFDNLVKVLQNARLIDDRARWIGGKAHLVQNGDIVDRGPHSRRAMDLLMELEEKAEEAGGRVHVLIGNHEAMNAVGIYDLVSPEEFEAFVDRDSRERRHRTFERYYDQLRREAKEKGEEVPRKGDVRRNFDEKYPLGFVEHRRAFDVDGHYGSWIRSLNTSIKINGILFSHGDWSEKFSEIGLAEVNDRVRRELRGETPIQNGLTFDEVSPLQWRGLANTELTSTAQAQAQPLIDRILTNLGAKRMVVGHTLTGGFIESRFGGKHISIDVGMLELYRGGHRIALEIDGDALRAIHDGGTTPIPEVMNETTIDDYVVAVAAVDPTNVDVQLRRVDALREEGRLDEAVPILETLLQSPDYVPFRYRELLGEYYLSRGETEKAAEEFRSYVEGLSQLVAANPTNFNLANLLARFCIDKNVELDLAENVIETALEHEPGNYSFRLTMARVQLAQDEYSKALEVLAGGEATEGFTYDRSYVTGLAYLGLDERDKARAAFEKAVTADPTRDEAQEELHKLRDQP